MVLDNHSKTTQKEVFKQPKVNQTEKPLKLKEEDTLILENVVEQVSKIQKPIKAKKEKLVSPAARKIATESNIDINTIKGTGKNGIILKEDI